MAWCVVAPCSTKEMTFDLASARALTLKWSCPVPNPFPAMSPLLGRLSPSTQSVQLLFCNGMSRLYKRLRIPVAVFTALYSINPFKQVKRTFLWEIYFPLLLCLIRKYGQTRTYYPSIPPENYRQRYNCYATALLITSGSKTRRF